MDDKITIIEGPTPTFETVDDGWAIGLNESPYLYDTFVTRLRTFNSHALVERCHRAWNDQSSMFLHYRNDIGMEEKVPIVAARSIDSQEGQVLVLWIRLQPDDTETEIDISDDDDDNFES
jgi:hypothetical protein